mgnify:CR=1 FL=1
MILSISLNTAAFEVTIDSEAEIASSEIKLGEIAEIKAESLSSEQLKELKNLTFKQAPAPGYSRRLSQVLVDLSIQNLGYDQNEFKLKMPKKIKVSRKTATISEKEISNLVEKYLKDKLDYSPTEMILESRASDKSVKIAAGEYDLRIAEDQSLSLPDVNLKLEVWQHKKKIRQIFYLVKINLLLEVLVAVKDLSANTSLKKSDFKTMERKISSDPEKIITDSSELDFNNIKLSRSLNKGDVLKRNYLKVPIAVKWGQKLHLKVKKNSIRISTFVKAKERGRIGDIITVENLNSGYEFQVKVVSPTEVKMPSD